MNNKVIYLKSLIKDFKPKTETFPKDIVLELEKMGIDLVDAKKPKDLQADKLAGRSFILNHTEEFLNHVVDYSLADKLRDYLHEPIPPVK
tara:strand:+ start:242 stop:511 length:270 start_codon:yes stop_codon:yes gene_type:complete